MAIVTMQLVERALQPIGAANAAAHAVPLRTFLS
jgi:hypothetical protein